MNSAALDGFHRYRPAAWLKVSGPDSEEFLQGQFSNDVKGLAPRKAIYGLWLDAKGKIMADSFVIRSEVRNEFWILSYFSAAEPLRKRLEDYIIADDVAVEDLTGDWEGVSILGNPLVSDVFHVGFILEGRRTAAPNLEWIFPSAAADSVMEGLAGRAPISKDALELERIRSGIPAVPADAGALDLPGEAGLAEVAISYTKGCYLGQEIMARLKTRGSLRKSLVRVEGQGRVPALPAPLWQDQLEVGVLRSASQGGEDGAMAGLAMMTLSRFRPEVKISYAPTGPALLSAK